jgi:small subunit ribosomal protein S1
MATGIKKENPISWTPAEEEGWWEAVMADEDKRPAFHAPRTAPVRSAPAPVAVPASAAVMEMPRPKPNWELARTIYQQDQIVRLVVAGFNRGGLLVEGEGLQGFVPYSHLLEMNDHAEEDRDAFLAQYVGRALNLKVIECVPDEGRVVFSERAARGEAGCRTKLFDTLHIGQRISGDVTNVTDFGAFVDLGGVEGLIHISELSWGRVIHPSDLVKVGQKVEVQVLEIAPERCRVALSLKRLLPNPWEQADKRYAIGAILPAVITSVASYGAFARLEEGLEGLIHVSEMALSEGQSVRETFSEGQSVQVRVLQVDAAHQRLGLSLRLDGNE